MVESAEQRAARRRATWEGSVCRVSEAPGPNLKLHRATVQEMVELATHAWLLAGRSLPSYERSEAPGRVVRPWRS